MVRQSLIRNVRRVALQRPIRVVLTIQVESELPTETRHPSTLSHPPCRETQADPPTLVNLRETA